MAHLARSLAALVVGAGVLGAGYALARGVFVPPSLGDTGGGLSFFSSAPSAAPAPAAAPSRAYDEEDRPSSHPKHKQAAVSSKGGAVYGFGYGKPVCVRLCDGSFFPTATTSGGDAACAAQCPDAPTALYTMPTDRIEDAVSSAGKPYTMLPVAKRYQNSVENTCACHRDNVASRAKELLHDPTLRKGDVVMTATGFRVYEGSGYSAAAEKDFVSLPQAGGVPRDERATLAAMERATAAGARAPAAPAPAAEHAKGSVTVDDGAPAPAPERANGNVTVDNGNPPPAQ
jgi:hypothetical protein